MHCTGDVSSVVVKYGTNDQLVNQLDMYYESTESLWIGYIDNHQGNTFLQMRAFATTSESAEGVMSQAPSAESYYYSGYEKDKFSFEQQL